MKVLSVRQPWASLIVHGPKRVENRTWRTDYRGPLLIHAAKSRKSLWPGADSIEGLPPLAFGAIIGLVDLVDCIPVERMRRIAPADHFVEGPWCWRVANPRPIELAPCQGTLGLFDLPDEIAASLRWADGTGPINLEAWDAEPGLPLFDRR